MITAAGTGLRVHLLGHPRFFSGGVPHPFHGRTRSPALLAFLMLHRGAYLSRDQIAFSLWPDDPETQARANLRRHLHDLTQALPPSGVPYFVTEDDTIMWNDDAGVWLDVWEFEESAREESRWAQAVELYAGELLAAVFDDWIFPLRDRLHRIYLSTLENLAQTARSRRDFSVAISYTERILADDAWREDAVRQLASIRYEAGDRSGALRELTTFAARLAEELKVEPMPETLALRALMLRGGALPGAAGEQAFDDRTPANVFPFVGRSSELEQLLGAWQRSARSRGEIVLIGAEAGMGKTRLVNELALRAYKEGGRVLRGTTSSPEKIPYQSIVEALRDALPLIASLEIRPLWLAAVAALVPELSLHRSDLPALPALDAQRERSRLFEALAAVINGLAKQRPLLLVLEDVHWAGEATQGALEYLARRLAAMPALVLATYRSERDAAQALGTLRRRLQLENLAEHVALSGLSQGEVCDLARAIPELAQSAEGVGLQVHAATGGNPLFAGELLHELAETGTSVGISRGLQATLEARTSRLGEPARMVAEIASVVGTTFDVEVICGVLGWSESAVLEGVAELLERNLAREVGRTRFAFAFTHQLIASTIYASIAHDRQARWHARIAALLGALDGDREHIAALLALHYDRAGDPTRAAAHYLAAARHAFAVFANREALAQATRGLELADEDETRFQLFAIRESILSRVGERELQRADLDKLERLADFSSDRAARAEVLWRRALLAHARGALDEEARFLNLLAETTTETSDWSRHAAALRETARNAMDLSRYDEAESTAKAALALYRDLEDVRGEIESLCLLAEIAVNHGTMAAAPDLLNEARERAETAQDPVLAARVAMTRAMTAIMQRDFAAALEASQQALARYADIGDREGEAEAGTRYATALSMLSRFDDARAAFGASADIYTALGNRLKLAYLLFNRSAVEIQLGLLEAAAGSLEAGLRIFEPLEDIRGRAVCRTNLSMIRLLQGYPEQAKDLALCALDDARQFQNQLIEAAVLSNLGNAERELGRLDEALGHMGDAIAIRRRLGLAATFEELGDLGLTQLKAGDPAAMQTAGEILQRSKESNDNTVWPHYCFWAAARVYHAAGDRRAKDALAQAASHVRRQIEAMADPDSRAAFAQLHAVRQIADAAEHDRWPD